MAKKRFDVEVPDGQHLGVSRDTDGAYRAHLFDDETNNLVGHAELFAPREDESSSSSLHVQDAYGSGSGAAEEAPSQLSPEEIAWLTDLVIRGAVVAAPHIKKWWTDTVVPAFKARGGLKSSFKRAPRRREDPPPIATAIVASVVDSAPVQSSSQLVVACQDDRIRMSSVEARERFVAAALAREFSDAQMKILQDAQIEDEEGPIELSGAIGTLTPHDVAETLKGILERNPSLLDGGTPTGLGPILADRGADGERVPLKIERFTDTPHAMDRHPKS